MQGLDHDFFFGFLASEGVRPLSYSLEDNMDVSLAWIRGFSILLLSFSLFACGDRYDLSTARGQQSLIDDANMHLSKGECAEANASIDPVYASTHVTDQIRIIKASAQACYAHFNLLTFASNIASSSNYFQSFAKSLDNVANDSARTWMYNAVDVLTQSGSVLGAGSRTAAGNSYMVFLQLGVISAIIRNYGSPNASTGAQGANLIYSATLNPAGEMSNLDACALTAAFSFVYDSYANSDLSDANSSSLVSSVNSICTSAGLSSCSVLSRDRTSCDGTNQNSVNAESVVTGVNSAW
jgi:hypothetical protein